MQESRTKPDGGVVVRGGLLLVPAEGAPRRADLWIRDGWIVAVSPPDRPPGESSAGHRAQVPPPLAVPPPSPPAAAPPVAPPPHAGWEEIDASDAWIIPGFIGGHVHLCQTLIRGTAERLDLYQWLQRVIWPMEAAHDEETMAISAEAGIVQLLAGGVTTILDMGTTRHAGIIIETAARLGLRGFFGPALMDRGPDAAAGLLRPGRESLDEIAILASRWDGHDDGRIRLALCPRFIPSVSDPLWRDLALDPAFSRLPIHTHGAETREEVEETRRLTGLTPPAYLAALPGAAGRVRMAHAIWLEGEDRGHLARAGITVLHCPGSNFKLGSGMCDTLALRDGGIAVAIGPDGAPCNNRLDPWQEMRLAAWLQGLLHRPSEVDPAAILRMATVDGARAIGLGHEVGPLERGRRADLVILDPASEPALCGAGDGFESPEAALVFAGSPALVRETMVAGRIVYRRDDPDRPARDRERMARARDARRRLALRSGLNPQHEESR